MYNRDWPGSQGEILVLDKFSDGEEDGDVLIEVGYRSAALAARVKNPQDRIKIVSKAV